MTKIKITKPLPRRKRRAIELFSSDSPYRPKIIPEKTKIYKRQKRIRDNEE